MEELEELTDEIESAADNSLDSSNASIENADDLENEDDNRVPFAFMPCAAHNLQLVIKDSLKLESSYETLINKVFNRKI